jgi:hypothetical protein
MTGPATTPDDDTAARTMSAAAESARYALLRRLAPSMRHHLVVPLQPIGMVYEIMDRRLRAPEPNLAEIHEGARKINGYARSALASCVDVVTWLAPDEKSRASAADALGECLALVQTAFTFRGFTLRDELADGISGEVARSAFRFVVTGALTYLSDVHPPPAHITISGKGTSSALVLTLSVAPGAGEQGFATTLGYRPLAWEDVEALAASESAEVQREGTSVRISLPWALASA